MKMSDDRFVNVLERKIQVLNYDKEKIDGMLEALKACRSTFSRKAVRTEKKHKFRGPRTFSRLTTRGKEYACKKKGRRYGKTARAKILKMVRRAGLMKACKVFDVAACTVSRWQKG